MLNFLLWNINRKKLDDSIAILAKEYDLDIIVIIEPNTSPGSLVTKLNESKVQYFHNSDSCQHVEIYSRFGSRLFQNVYQSKRTTAWHLLKEGFGEITLIATHFFDRWNNTERDQEAKIPRLLDEIEIVESKKSGENIILVGDLNFNPYDPICYSSIGLNAINCRTTAKRLVERDGKKLFYNPSWNLLGDKNHSPGTYYHSKPASPIWHVLDQVLIRPQIADKFDLDRFSIVNSINKEQLFTKNRVPLKNKYSDHLPVVFSLNN